MPEQCPLLSKSLIVGLLIIILLALDGLQFKTVLLLLLRKEHLFGFVCFCMYQTPSLAKTAPPPPCRSRRGQEFAIPVLSAKIGAMFLLLPALFVFMTT